MNSSAAGQLFGYTLQYPRALLRLIEASDDAFVSVEDFGDVGVENGEGVKISEEDKSSIAGKSPVLDRSENLWKTFYNWTQAVVNNELDADRDFFILYANHESKEDSIIVKLSKAGANNVSATLSAIKTDVIDVLSDSEHPLYKYVYCLFNQNYKLFEKIVARFELVCDKNADNVYDEIKRILKNRLMLPESRDVSDLVNYLTGWLQEKLMKKIAARQIASISRKDLVRYAYPQIKKLNNDCLIDFAGSKLPGNDYAENQISQKPTYIRQMDFVNADQDEQLTAVLDFYRASENRIKWIEDDVISKEDIEIFEKNLIDAYKSEQKRISLTMPSSNDVQRGHLLMVNCMDKDMQLGVHKPPYKTVAGSYHALSNNEELGWHPDWKNKLKQE